MVHYPIAQKWVRWAWRVLLVGVLLGNGHPCALAQKSPNVLDCVSKSCSYLPMIFVHAPAPIRIQSSVIGAGSRGGSNTYLGYIENLSQTPLYSVSIRVGLYDTSGHLVSSDVFETKFSATLPNQTNFTQGGISAYVGNGYHVEASVNSYHLASANTYISQSVIFSPSLEEYLEPRKYGYIYNTQAVTITNVTVAVWTFCGVITDLVTDTIKPGGYVSFTRSRCFYEDFFVSSLLGAQAQLLP